MQTKILVAVIFALAITLSFVIGRNCSPRVEPIDAESKQEIRSEMAIELYNVVDSCSSDLCLDTFSKETRMDIRAK